MEKPNKLLLFSEKLCPTYVLDSGLSSVVHLTPTREIRTPALLPRRSNDLRNKYYTSIITVDENNVMHGQLGTCSAQSGPFTP